MSRDRDDDDDSTGAASIRRDGDCVPDTPGGAWARLWSWRLEWFADGPVEPATAPGPRCMSILIDGVIDRRPHRLALTDARKGMGRSRFLVRAARNMSIRIIDLTMAQRRMVLRPNVSGRAA